MTDIQITCGACGSMFNTVTLPDNPSFVYTCPSCEAETDIDGNVVEPAAHGRDADDGDGAAWRDGGEVRK